MLFNSFEFIAAFLPITFLVYFMLVRIKQFRVAKVFLLAASLFFYGYNNKAFVVLILISMSVNYLVGRAESTIDRQSLRRLILVAGIVFNIVLLGYFKYYNFAVSNINSILSTDFNIINVLLPVGISFFTFQQLSYIVDCYRKELNNCTLLDYGLLIGFFPKILSGPLVDNKRFLAQLNEEESRGISFKNVSVGLYLLALGLFKKVIIADFLAVTASNGFDSNIALSFIKGWTTSLSYTFQLYFDFSGYCDMAYGIAIMFNIVLPMNFDSPYKAKSIKEFWNRWHITLGTFLTKYVYIPLGGNRKGTGKTYRNLFITFLISGLWHGSGWNFILWGVMHGIAMVIHRLWSNKGYKLNKYLAWFLTFNFVNAAWVFFRASNLKSAFNVLGAMVNFNSSSILNFADIKMVFTLLFIGIICVKTKNSNSRSEGFQPNFITAVLTVIFVIIAVTNFNKISNFVYFNF